MSKRVLSLLSDQFGRADCADCVVVFYTKQKESASNNEEPRIIGTLPAHRLILWASGRLRCESEGWNRYEPSSQCGSRSRQVAGGAEAGGLWSSGSRAKRRRFAPQDNSKQGKPAADDSKPSAQSPHPGPSNAWSLPELRVTLEREEELEPARTAIRYLYTKSLLGQQEQQQQQGPAPGGCSGAHPGSGLGVGELVVVAKVAESLEIVDCAEACYEALVACFKGASSGGSSSSSSSPAAPLAPVLELYSLRHLLPSPDHHPGLGPVLAACRARLLRHWNAQLPGGVQGPEGAAPPTKVDLLVWLLGCTDALRIANDPQLLQLWKELPLMPLEELLRSDHLSTDDEATVVLLVEEWVVAKGSGVTEADKERVRRQLRLVNCSTPYLFDVLPKLPWLGSDPARQAAFIARIQRTDSSEWKDMASGLGGYDITTPWYGKQRLRSVPAQGVSYKWEISREDLLAGLRKEGKEKSVKAVLQQHGRKTRANSQRVAALGYEWELEVAYDQEESHAGLLIACFIPAAIEAQTGKLDGAARVSFAMQVSTGASGTFESTEHVPYGWGIGRPKFLRLLDSAGPAAARQGQEESAADSDAALLAPWADLLGPEGKIRGVLTFYRLKR